MSIEFDVTNQRVGAFMEVDEVVVRASEWEKVKAGDAEAISALRARLEGMQLYMHALSVDPGAYVCVSIKELHEARVIESVTLTSYQK